jgi:zeaxanthin glucosyltransferase
MERIAIFVDGEEGHVLSTLELATELKARGHAVTYLGLAAAERLVRAHGFHFITAFEGKYPLEVKSAELLETVYGSALLCSLIRGEALDAIVSAVRPTVFITLSLFSLEALALKCRYKLPTVLVQATWLFSDRKATYHRLLTRRLVSLKKDAAEFLRLVSSASSVVKMDDVTALLLSMPELVLFPREFSDPADSVEPQVHYISPGVDLHRKEAPFRWDLFDERLPIIYSSMGSQPELKAETSVRLLQTVLQAFESTPALQLIVAAGKHADVLRAVQRSHVWITDWAPQMSILQRADVVITHGGSGTVKECIGAGLPMIVLPLMRDQFIGAMKVAQHGLGLSLDSRSVTPSALKEAIERVLNDRGYKDRVCAIQPWFTRSEWSVAADVVERAANSHRAC